MRPAIVVLLLGTLIVQTAIAAPDARTQTVEYVGFSDVLGVCTAPALGVGLACARAPLQAGETAAAVVIRDKLARNVAAELVVRDAGGSLVHSQVFCDAIDVAGVPPGGTVWVMPLLSRAACPSTTPTEGTVTFSLR